MKNFDITYKKEVEEKEDFITMKGRILNNQCIVTPFINMLEEIIENNLSEVDFTDQKDRKNPFHLLRVIKERNKNINKDTRIILDFLQKTKNDVCKKD